MQPGYQQPMAQPQYPQYGQPQFQPTVPYQQPPQAQVQVIVNTGPSVPLVAAPIRLKGYDRLEARTGLFIKQQMDIAEIISGCDKENVYYVYPMARDGEVKGNQLFKAKEKSGFCARQCMSAECRPFQLWVGLVDTDEALNKEPFLFLDRKCKCTFCCFNRPEISVTYVEDGKNEYVGKISDPWTLCDIALKVYDKDNKLKYIVEASFCQMGLLCNCPCCSCTVDFEIKSPSGHTLSRLQKKNPGCAKATLSTADNFALHFPPGATKEDKALLLSTVLFLDFRYFEEKNPSKKDLK